MNTQDVKHECPRWALNNNEYTKIYDSLPHWQSTENLETLRFYNSQVSSVLKAGDADFYRVRNDYVNILKCAEAKNQPTLYINGEIYRKSWCRASIKFFHRWQYERVAYVLFIEGAIRRLEQNP